MTNQLPLPEGFEALAPFITRWALGTTSERDQARGDSQFEDLEAYYRAAKPLLQPALAYLDTRPVKELDDRDRRLMDMMLSLAHVAMAVEIHREMETQHAVSRGVMPITRSTTDPVQTG